MKKEFKEIYIYCFVTDSFGTLNYQEKYKTKLVYKDAYTSWYATEGKNGLCFPRQRNVQNFALDLRSMINYATDDLHHVWEGWESESRIASPFEFSEEEIKNMWMNIIEKLLKQEYIIRFIHFKVVLSSMK